MKKRLWLYLIFLLLLISLLFSYFQFFINNSQQYINAEDKKIENFYKHPNIWKDIDNQCKEVIVISKWSFDTFEPIYFPQILCMTWEINKKLTKKQIKLLSELKYILNKIIFDFNQGDKYTDTFDVVFNASKLYNIELITRIYNLIYNQKWPECLHKINATLDYSHVWNIENMPCNKPSKLLHRCEKEQDIISCMENGIISEISKFKTEKSEILTEDEYRKMRFNDIKHLFNITKKFIMQIINDSELQKKEIIRLYDFFWSAINRTYQYALFYSDGKE